MFKLIHGEHQIEPVDVPTVLGRNQPASAFIKGFSLFSVLLTLRKTQHAVEHKLAF